MGYFDIQKKIQETLTGRSAGSQITPDTHQSMAEALLEYIRDVEDIAVDDDVAVVDELSGGGAGRGDAEAIDHVVEARFHQLHQHEAGHAFLAAGQFKRLAELSFEHESVTRHCADHYSISPLV